MEKEIKTVRIEDRLIVINGMDELAYIDLTKVNKGPRQEAIVRYGDKHTEQRIGQISDGYHTFDELYHYRALYHAAWLKSERFIKQHKSRKHSDGTMGSVDSLLKKPGMIELIDYEIPDTLREQGFTPAVYPRLTDKGVAAIQEIMKQRELDLLDRLESKKTGKTIYNGVEHYFVRMSDIEAERKALKGETDGRK